MKKYLTKIIFLVAISFGEIHTIAQGYIVPNGVIYVGFSPFAGGNEIDVAHNPTNGNSTGFALVPVGIGSGSLFTNIFLFEHIVDVGVRVFFTSANQAVTTNLLLSGSLTELVVSSPQTFYTINSSSIFYLALYTGDVQFAPPNGVYDNPMLGWVKLRNNQGSIEMISGAIEYGGLGIYAGTQNIIQPSPEPSAFALALLGSLVFGLCRRNK
jgi:hypothetical protein